MKKFYRNIALMSVLVILAYLPIVYYNLKIDPYGIFRTNFDGQEIEPNEHFIKMKLLTTHRIEKDSFIFGSSRVGKIDPSSNGYIQNYYNLTYSEGVPSEHLQDIKFLLDEGVVIKNIIVGLDYVSYTQDPGEHRSQLLRIPYPDNPFSLYLTYMKYLFAQPSLDVYAEIKKPKEFKVEYDLFNTGVPRVLGKDDWIENNRTQHVEDDKFTMSGLNINGKQRIDSTIEEINEIINICKNNDIKPIVFINPMHQATYRSQNFSEYYDFLRKLSNITDYYDFAGVNKITGDNYYYYETSHYRPIVGNMMIDKIFGDIKQDNFGVYVTKNNINEHINNLKTELNSALSSM